MIIVETITNNIEILTFLAATSATLVSGWGIHESKKSSDNLIKAEVESKSRIVWLQESRNVTADFINAAYNLLIYVPYISIGESQQITEKSAQIEMIKHIPKITEVKYEELKSQVNKTGYKLILMFGPSINGDKNKKTYINNLIITMIKKVINDLTSIEIKDYTIFEAEKSEYGVLIADLTEILRLFYKIEWEKTKKIKKIKKIEKQLYNHDIYKKIRSKYSTEKNNK